MCLIVFGERGAGLAGMQTSAGSGVDPDDLGNPVVTAVG